MGIFNRRPLDRPAYGSASVRAAAGGSSKIPGALGRAVGVRTQRALTVPTISRARNLIIAMVGALELRQYTRQWTGEQWETIYTAGEGWLDRPDPDVSRNFLLANTTSDLFMTGRAFWYVTSRYSTGFPASFTWLPEEIVTTPDQLEDAYWRPAHEIQVNGQKVDTRDVIQFLSPVNGIRTTAARTLDIAIRLDEAAKRFANSEIAAGYLQQTGGEPMSGEELAEMASAWAENRQANAIGALNEFVKFVEFESNPSTLQLVEGRQYAALELARVANIPPYLVGVPTGGMTYQNAQQARQDLYLFGAKPFVDCIEQTLSGPNVLPRGRYIELDVQKYLGEAHIVDQVPVEPPAAERTPVE